LMRVLSTPLRVANALDWRQSTGGAIATLDVHADRIGVRISQHPKPPKHSSLSLSSSSWSKAGLPVVSQYSLPISPRGRFEIPNSTRQQLSDLVHHHGVCGFVVSWPIQEDTGLMGAACGRTLFAIEELLKNNNDYEHNDDERASYAPNEEERKRPVFAPNRPLCLWDGSEHPNRSTTRDAFFRSPVYARTSDKTEHFASKEQYHQDESIVASRVWDDFVRIHWPGLDRGREEQWEEETSCANDKAWSDECASSKQWQAAIAA
jgi:hypothetical protein